MCTNVNCFPPQGWAWLECWTNFLNAERGRSGEQHVCLLHCRQRVRRLTAFYWRTYCHRRNVRARFNFIFLYARLSVQNLVANGSCSRIRKLANARVRYFYANENFSDFWGLLGFRVRFPAGAFAIFSVSAKASLPISLSLSPFPPLPFPSSSFPFPSPFDLSFALKNASSHLSH